jgi:aldose 1-epimerase
MTDAVALAAGAARVVIAPATGGALASFALGDADILRPTPAGSANVRAHACYPLVPYSNRIADARLEFEGKTYSLARNFGEHPHSIHGVGWQRPWAVAAHDATSARLELEHTATGSDASAWPWPFRATQSFALRADATGATLTLRLTLANTGDAAFPFGLGWHPFFVRSKATRLGFRAQDVWMTNATQLPTKLAPALPGGPFEPARDPGPALIDNVFTGWDGAATLDDADRRIAVALGADRAASFLIVYTPERAAFVALEPVTHMTDAFNRAAHGEQGTGTRTLRPGRAFSCTMEIGVRHKP